MKKVISICLVLVFVFTTSAYAMNKAQILDKIEKKVFADGGKFAAIVKIIPAATEYDGTKMYKIVVREENGDFCQYRSVFIYVVDEGLPKEKAFFVDERGIKQAVKKDQ